MKPLKKFLALSLVFLLLFSLAACGETNETPRTPAAVAYSGKPISIARSTLAADFSLAKLFDDETYVISDADIAAAPMTTDLAVVPLWRVPQLLDETPDSVQILAVNTFGTASVVTNGTSIGGVKDLVGKTILVGEPTAASEEALSRVMGTLKTELESLLETAGVTATVEDSVDAAVYEKVIDGSAQIAVLPEPYATLAVAKSGAAVAFTLTNAWIDARKSQPLVENCVIAKKSFIESNPDGVQKVLADLRASVEWVNLHPGEATDLLIEKGLVSADVLQVNEEQSDRKQAAAKTQQAVDLIARANVVLMEGTAMVAAIDAMQREPALPDSCYYIAK